MRFQVKHLNDKVVYVCCAAGQVDCETLAAVLEQPHEQGVTTVLVEQRGKMRNYEL